MEPPACRSADRPRSRSRTQAMRWASRSGTPATASDPGTGYACTSRAATIPFTSGIREPARTPGMRPGASATSRLSSLAAQRPHTSASRCSGTHSVAPHRTARRTEEGEAMNRIGHTDLDVFPAVPRRQRLRLDCRRADILRDPRRLQRRWHRRVGGSAGLLQGRRAGGPDGSGSGRLRRHDTQSQSSCSAKASLCRS